MDQTFAIGSIFNLISASLVGLTALMAWWTWQSVRGFFLAGLPEPAPKNDAVIRVKIVITFILLVTTIVWMNNEKVWFRPEIRAHVGADRNDVQQEILSTTVVVPEAQYQSPKEGLDLEVRQRVEEAPDLEGGPK